MIIKGIILIISLFYIFYRIGMLINKYLKLNNKIEIIVMGFVGITSLLQIIYIPMILLHVAFELVFYLTIFLCLFLVGISFFVVPIKNIEVFSFKFSFNILVFLVVLVVISQAFVSSYLYNENADDSFYVSLIEQNKSSKKIYQVDPSLGIEDVSNLKMYMVSGHELALSVLSKLYNIPSTILAHSFIPFVMVILSYLAYYVFARCFFDSKKSLVFILLLSIVFLFSGFTTRLRGIILFSRMWQGKEIFLNIILTMILSNLITLKKNQKKNLISLFILNFSAVFFTNTAIFLVPFAYMGFGIIELWEKHFKTFGKLILTGIPIIIYAIIYLILNKTTDQIYNKIYLINILKDYMGTGKFWILYLASIIIIALKGNKDAKKYFIFVVLINVLTIYNPLLTNIIAKYFTSNVVFWRLFWLLPMEFSICYSFVLLIFSFDKLLYRALVIVFEIVLIILAGKFVFTKENGFEKPQNLNKIPEEIIYQANFILEKQKQTNPNQKATIMANPEPYQSCMLRQLSSEFNIFFSRDHYMTNIYSDEEIDKMQKIRCIYYNLVPQLSFDEFNDIRQNYDINWIIIDVGNDEIINYLNQTNPSYIYKIQGYNLYQY